MYPTIIPALRKFLGGHEGVCNFMYLDTKGFITTGIGNLIEHKPAAYALEWLRDSDDKVASQAEVDAEWEQISRQLDTNS